MIEKWIAMIEDNSFLRFAWFSVIAFFGWFFICFCCATFMYSLQEPSSDIMWRQGLAEPLNQLQGLYDKFFTED